MDKQQQMVKEKLFDILERNLKLPEDVIHFNWDEDLKRLGLNSMTSITIILNIEDEFGIAIPDEFLNDETFKSANNLLNTINSIISE